MGTVTDMGAVSIDCVLADIAAYNLRINDMEESKMSRYEVTNVQGKPTDAGGMVITLKITKTEQKRKSKNTIRLTFVIFAILFIWGVISLVGFKNSEFDTKSLPRHEISTEFEMQPTPQIEIIENEEQPSEVKKEVGFYNPAIPLSYEKQEMLYNAAEEFDVPYNLALSVVWKETNFKNVQGDNGRAYGYFQIWEKWHSGRMAKLGVSDLMDTEGNFRVGCSLLADYLKSYGNVHKALMVYNMGAGGASKAWIEGDSSSGYSRAIVDYMARLS